MADIIIDRPTDNKVYINKDASLSDIDQTKQDVLTAKNDVLTAKTSVDTTKTNIDTIYSSIQTLDSNVTVNASNVSTNTSLASGYANSALNSYNNIVLVQTDINNTKSLIDTTATNVQGLADNASTSATNASASEANALGYKDTALTYRDETLDARNETYVTRTAVNEKYALFHSQFIGAYTTNNLPTVGVDTGALAYDLTDLQLKAFNGAAWIGATKGDSVTNVTSTKVGTTTTVNVYIEDVLVSSFDIEDGQEAYTDAEIKTKYENNADTNAYTDTEKTKLAGIEDNANNYVLPLDITADSLQLNGGTGTQGLVSWNTDESTLDLIQNGTTLQVGQEVQYNVRNNSGATIPNGTVVMATGTIGASGRITVSPANTTDAKLVLGVTTEDIADSTDGKVTCFGKVRQVDTSSWLDGDVLYVGSNGALTNVEPTNGLSMPIGFVIHSATNGTLFVRVTPIDENQFTVLQNNIDNIVSGTTNIGYNNTVSGLTATNVKSAIDELDSRLDDLFIDEEW